MFGSGVACSGWVAAFEPDARSQLIAYLAGRRNQDDGLRTETDSLGEVEVDVAADVLKRRLPYPVVPGVNG
jgi:hypothetical protein